MRSGGWGRTFFLASLVMLFGLTSAAWAKEACSPAIGTGFVKDGYRYTLTKEFYNGNGSLNSAAKFEFGPKATAADWRDLKSILLDRDEVLKFFNALGLKTQGSNQACNNYLLDVNGKSKDGRYHFFIARHDGIVPKNWFALNTIDHHALDLGRWTYPGQVLVKLPVSNGLTEVSGSSAESKNPVASMASIATPRLGDSLSGRWGTNGAVCDRPNDIKSYAHHNKLVRFESGEIIFWWLPVADEGQEICKIESQNNIQGTRAIAASCEQEDVISRAKLVIRLISQSAFRLASGTGKVGLFRRCASYIRHSTRTSLEARDSKIIHHLIKGQCVMDYCYSYIIDSVSKVARNRSGVLKKEVERSWMTHYKHGYSAPDIRKFTGTGAEYFFCSKQYPAVIFLAEHPKKWLLDWLAPNNLAAMDDAHADSYVTYFAVCYGRMVQRDNETIARLGRHLGYHVSANVIDKQQIPLKGPREVLDLTR